MSKSSIKNSKPVKVPRSDFEKIKELLGPRCRDDGITLIGKTSTVEKAKEILGPHCGINDCPNSDGRHPFHKYVGTKKISELQNEVRKLEEENRDLRRKTIADDRTLKGNN